MLYKCYTFFAFAGKVDAYLSKYAAFCKGLSVLIVTAKIVNIYN